MILDKLKAPLPQPTIWNKFCCTFGCHEWVYTRRTHRINLKWPYRICLYCRKVESYSVFTLNKWKPSDRQITLENYAQ